MYYSQAFARNATGDRKGALETLGRAIALSPRDGEEAITLYESLILRGNLFALENRTEEEDLSYWMAQEASMITI